MTQFAYFSARAPLNLCVISAPGYDVGGKQTQRDATEVKKNAKTSGYALKQGSKTQSSQRQSNLQRQNQAALMPCRMRTVEHKKCVAGVSQAQPGLQDRMFI